MKPLRGLSVLVTGGSRGLGLLLAGECMARGCAVTIAARDREELDRATAKLRHGDAQGANGRSGAAGAGGTSRAAETAARTGGVTGRVCDVRDRDAVGELVARTAEEQRGLDVVLAVAGVIQVGPAEAAGEEGFRDAMDTMFFGSLHTALAALPLLRDSPAGGRLGLVGSVGGLIPVPHMVPYSCAKFAVGALAQGLRAEQAARGVSVTAIHPGLMRTGSHVQAEFAGDPEREYRWFATLAGTPLVSMSAERAAARIVRAVERRRSRLVLTPAARLGDKAYRLAPTLVTGVNSAAARLLPAASADGGGAMVSGGRIERGSGRGRSRWEKAISAMNDRASRRLNETGGAP
ncbi:SDR family NAD(P)-dependent oxidoreductase [Streptomyces sp. 184]|uniref:SDR family NAD(P)-dependent oxidoreductase n=1 Tax=Streptomyces sp. 184 TaxID=1827526 RepID=UPI003891E34D